jgi:hypothetical protein
MTTEALRWVGGTATPAKTYITRVFNFGTTEEWEQMKGEYTAEQIAEAVHQPLPGQWTRRGKAFAETLFGITMPDAALISYDV